MGIVQQTTRYSRCPTRLGQKLPQTILSGYAGSLKAGGIALKVYQSGVQNLFFVLEFMVQCSTRRSMAGLCQCLLLFFFFMLPSVKFCAVCFRKRLRIYFNSQPRGLLLFYSILQNDRNSNLLCKIARVSI